jgi:hypothetical protein
MYLTAALTEKLHPTLGGAVRDERVVGQAVVGEVVYRC